jgi:ankyrin repeat protein
LNKTALVISQLACVQVLHQTSDLLQRDGDNNSLLHLATFDGKILEKWKFKQEEILARVEAKERNDFEFSSNLTYRNNAEDVYKLALIKSLDELEGQVNNNNNNYNNNNSNSNNNNINVNNVVNNLFNNDGNTPLHTSVIGGNLKIVKFLVEHLSADGNIKNKEGETPLDLANKLGLKNIADYLNHNIL